MESKDCPVLGFSCPSVKKIDALEALLKNGVRSYADGYPFIKSNELGGVDGDYYVVPIPQILAYDVLASTDSSVVETYGRYIRDYGAGEVNKLIAENPDVIRNNIEKTIKFVMGAYLKTDRLIVAVECWGNKDYPCAIPDVIRRSIEKLCVSGNYTYKPQMISNHGNKERTVKAWQLRRLGEMIGQN